MSLFTSADHDAHKSRRRAIAPFFSKPDIASRQHVLHRNLDKLCQRISGLSGSTFNLGAAISAFTRDSANEFIVGRQYNELDLNDFGVGLSTASQGAGPFWRTTKHVRWFGPMMRAMPIDWAMKVADDNTKAFLSFLKQSEQDTRDTLAVASSSSSDKSCTDTMIHSIVYSDLPEDEKSFDRVLEEVMTVTGAAFETTASALRLILYHVYTSEEILRRLREEVASLPTGPSDTISLKQLEKLQFFTAVLTEGMRLSPAVSSRAARVTDKDLSYDKWQIPAGTPVGMTTLLMQTDETLYPDPMRFNPDRWLVSGAAGATASKYAPFGRGTRTCLGMHLAWAEMYQLLAALVQRFDFTIKDATAGDFELQKDNFAIGTKAGCNLMAHVTKYKG
ncbi:cytochrome P450 [Diaporthe eres]|nr:cytochrome P450 [Diaporthe eres]